MNQKEFITGLKLEIVNVIIDKSKLDSDELQRYPVLENALRKRSSIQQEIWARAILYNFCFIIIRELAKRKSLKKRRYIYVINKTRAIHLIRDLLLKRKGGAPPNLEALISNETLPLRPGHSDPRKVRTQSVISFNYRFS